MALLDPEHTSVPATFTATTPPLAVGLTVITVTSVYTVEHNPIVTFALKAVVAAKAPVLRVGVTEVVTAVHVGVAAVQLVDFCQTIEPKFLIKSR